MNAGATMELKLSAMFLPIGRNKKILAITAGVFLLTLGSAAYSTYSVPADSPRVVPQGNDAADLVASRKKTGLTLSGTVTVNNQFPLGTGYVIAYDAARTRAIAYSSLDKYGRYIMKDVPPTSLVLLVKRRISDDVNPAFLAATGEQAVESRHVDKFTRAASGQMVRVLQPGQTLVGDSAHSYDHVNINSSKKRLGDYGRRDIKLDAFTPELENLPDVKWMIDRAFTRYGKFSPEDHFVVKPSENNRTFSMDLESR